MKRPKNEKVFNDYLDYLESEEATIVFITKNLVNSVDTKKKWIDVVEFDCWGIRGKKYAFNYFIVELFERKIWPKFPKGATIEMKRAITWNTAHEDIQQQRFKGIRGPMFLITCPLYNVNKGKKELKYEKYWNEEYGGFDFTGKVPTTTRVRKIDKKPDWKYRITGVKKINDNNFQYIQRNYKHIYERILKGKHVMIDWFFEK